MSTRPLDPTAHSLADAPDARATLIKPSDGFVSRMLNRRISIPISRQLARTRVTPNQISVFNLSVGIAAAGFAATGATLHVMIGGLLFQVASILDGCDGEVAKLTDQATPNGAWVDTLTDNLSYVAFCLGVTSGYFRRVDSPYVLVLGGTATTFIVVSLGLMYLCLSKHGAAGTLLRFGDAAMKQARQGKDSRLKQVISRLEFVVRRDFFALFFFGLALVDRLDWIFWSLVAGSVGLLVSVLISYRQVSADLNGPDAGATTRAH